MRQRKAIPKSKRVAIVVWWLTEGGRFDDVALHFDVGKSTCMKITEEFCGSVNRLSTCFVKFLVTCCETTRAITLFSRQV